jgi:hypothetical protein
MVAGFLIVGFKDVRCNGEMNGEDYYLQKFLISKGFQYQVDGGHWQQ